MADNYTPMPVKGLKTNNSAPAAAGDSLATLPAVAHTAAPTHTNGNQVALSVDTSGSLRVVTSGGGTTVTYNTSAPTLSNGQTAPLQGDTNGNLKVVFPSTPTVTVGNATLAVTQSGTWNVGQTGTWNVGLSAGSALVGKIKLVDTAGTNELAINASGQLAISNFPASQAVTISAGAATIGNVGLVAGAALVGGVKVYDTGGTNQLAVNGSGQVTISNSSFTIGNGTSTNVVGTVYVASAQSIQVSKNTSANAVTNAIFTTLTDGTNALGTVSNPLVVASEDEVGALTDSGHLTTADVAAGASTTLSGTVFTTGTGRLAEVTASSSVPLKVVVQKFNGTTGTAVRTFFVSAGDCLVYQPKDTSSITQAGAASACFRVVITNMDNSNTADVYASISHLA